MKKLAIEILGTLGILALTACGTSNDNLASAPLAFPCIGVGCTITASGSSVAPIFSTGDTESWNPVSQAVLSEYVGYGLTAPTNYLVNIALIPTAGSNPMNYSGTLTIQFIDGATVHNGTFSNGSGTETYNGYSQKVNGLVGSTGVYRIYFEDPLGGIIVTMAPIVGTDTSTTLTGSIYFKNFNSTAPNPLFQGAYDSNGTYFPPGNVFCWMISTGPYDCINNTVPPTSGGATYILLGTIPTVNVTNALGI